MHKFNNFQ